jgi:uncharacterized BrkB/YihY/UPF0761 family membrane protein
MELFWGLLVEKNGGEINRVRKIVAAILLVLLFLAYGHFFLHHHSDLFDHSDCAICQVMHRVAIVIAAPVSAIIFSRVLRFAPHRCPVKIIPAFYSAFLSRAPPALV